jgi:hypothetical protein
MGTNPPPNPPKIADTISKSSMIHPISGVLAGRGGGRLVALGKYIGAELTTLPGNGY